MMRLQTAATNIVQTAASRSQDHWCLGTFPDVSLNIIGCARLVSLVGPVVFIRCWFKKGERKTVREMAPSHQRFLARARQRIDVLIDDPAVMTARVG
jgi:hypothetical protein